MESTTEIIQIVPQLPPSINGLGDYALNLARQLRKDCGIETHFIVGDPHWEGDTEIEGFAAQPVRTQTSKSLFLLLSDDGLSRGCDLKDPVLLHYVGYGYAKRGCPVWLVEGLERWKPIAQSSRLITMFHEIYNSGPPWRSSFWLSPLQRNLAARLALVSDTCFTTRQGYADMLYELSNGKHRKIPTIPVFSNIGEPVLVPPLAERARRLVVFGHRNSRLQVYQQCRTSLEQICLALKIEEVYDIGVPTGMDMSQIKGISVVEMGVTEPTEISEILLNSLAGFWNFPPPDHLAKSTIFAAYCAHRLIPIRADSSAMPIDGIQGGKHYWVADEQAEPLNLDVGQAIADNAHAWYKTHSLSVQAKIFADSLKR